METHGVYVPGAERGRLGIRSVPFVAMHLRTFGPDAEASIRQMCSGQLPVVGQRYVWLCTGVSATDTGDMQADFQLTPLEEGARE